MSNSGVSPLPAQEKNFQGNGQITRKKGIGKSLAKMTKLIAERGLTL